MVFVWNTMVVLTAVVRREFKIFRKSKSHYHEAHEEHEVKNVCGVYGIRFCFHFIPGGS
jgi:hypothetical protein